MKRVDIWPLARDHMTPDELAEVRAWSHTHGRVQMGYSVRDRRYFAHTEGNPSGFHATSPIEAFRRSLYDGERVEILTLITGPGEAA